MSSIITHRKNFHFVAALLISLLNSGVALALPDLVVEPAVVSPQIVVQNFTGTDCSVVEGCTTAGQRRLLVFNSETRNDGTTDLVLGNPVGNPLFEFFACHGHWHLKDYMNYRLRNTSTSQVVAGYKQSFCLSDSIRVNTNASTSPLYNCSNQGIQAGWADIYFSNLPCQWVDITGVPGGNYILEMEVNESHTLVESNYANNITSVSVTIPPAATVGNWQRYDSPIRP